MDTDCSLAASSRFSAVSLDIWASSINLVDTVLISLKLFRIPFINPPMAVFINAISSSPFDAISTVKSPFAIFSMFSVSAVTGFLIILERTLIITRTTIRTAAIVNPIRIYTIVKSEAKTSDLLA